MNLMTTSLIAVLILAQGETPPNKASAPKGTAGNTHVIERAYQKEFAYLVAQKKMLAKRLEQVKQNYDKKIGAEEAALEKKHILLMGTTLAADKLDAALREVEENDASQTNHEDVLDTLFEQASSSLTQVEVSFERPSGEDPDYAKSLEKLTRHGVDLLSRGSAIREEKSSFFLTDGTQTPGSVFWIGNIAAYGVSQAGSGALVPAGERKLKVFGQDLSDTADKLKAKNTMDSMSIFLFDSLDKPIEERESKSLLEFLKAGGVIAFVIVGLGLVGLVLVLLRAFLLWRAGAKSEEMVGEVTTVMTTEGLDAAHGIVKSKPGVVAFVLERVLSHLNEADEKIEEVLSEAILHKLPIVERFGNAILVFAAVAPLLGLLGTVTGMIATFDIITEHGTGDPRMLSGGISEALITTQLGLMVAIPLLLLGNLLKSKALELQRLMERSALRVLNIARLLPGGTTLPSGPNQSSQGSADSQLNQVSQQLGSV